MFIKQMIQYLEPRAPADVEVIAPLIVTFRNTLRDQPNSLHQELLQPNPDLAKLFPGAPHHALFEDSLRRTITGFEREFEKLNQLETGHELPNWRDLLRLNLRHALAADRQYYNGQAVVTRIVLADGRFSLALHQETDLAMFKSKFASGPSLHSQNLAIVRTEAEARSLAIQWLSEAEERKIPVRVQGHPDTMTWRTWGRLPGPHGYSRRGLVLTLGSRSLWTELQEWGGADFEPYAVLNRLADLLPGVEADTCATCRSFTFSGMSRDCSGGRAGYCLLLAENYAPGLPPPGVEVNHRCERHEKIVDANREFPYLQVK